MSVTREELLGWMDEQIGEREWGIRTLLDPVPEDEKIRGEWGRDLVILTALREMVLAKPLPTPSRRRIKP